jgi:hypothetical protein
VTVNVAVPPPLLAVWAADDVKLAALLAGVRVVPVVSQSYFAPWLKPGRDSSTRVVEMVAACSSALSLIRAASRRGCHLGCRSIPVSVSLAPAFTDVEVGFRRTSDDDDGGKTFDHTNGTRSSARLEVCFSSSWMELSSSWLTMIPLVMRLFLRRVWSSTASRQGFEAVRIVFSAQ